LTLEEGEVHGADDSPVLLGELVNGAVVQPSYALVVLVGLVAALAERSHDRSSTGWGGSGATLYDLITASEAVSVSDGVW
jgi:hypothetical protein